MKKSGITKNTVYRFSCYLAGMIILSLGIVVNTKSDLGVSPIISVAHCFSVITGMKFADTTQIWYTLFILVQIIIHLCLYFRNKRTDKAPKGADKKLGVILLQDVLQLPVSFLVTRFVGLFDNIVPNCGDELYADTFYGSIPAKIIVLLVGILLTGVGIALSVNMRLIPNPGDGIVQAITDAVGRKLGTVKNFFDIGCVLTSVICGLIFAHRLIGINVGTFAAMILVGRTVALFNHLFLERMLKGAGLENKAATSAQAEQTTEN